VGGVPLAHRNRNHLKNFLKNLGSASLGFIQREIRNVIEFGEQGLYLKSKIGVHRQRTYAFLDEPGVTSGTLAGDCCPFACGASALKLRPSSALGGAVRDERPATRTWVRDVRRFLGHTPRKTYQSQKSRAFCDSHHRPRYLESLPSVAIFCTKPVALQQFPPGPMLMRRDSRARFKNMLSKAVSAPSVKCADRQRETLGQDSGVVHAGSGKEKVGPAQRAGLDRSMERHFVVLSALHIIR